MTCTNPVLLKNPKLRNLRPNTHRGIEEAHPGFYVPCGKCMACRIARTREWTLRLLMEREKYESSCFITLTYDDDHLRPDCGLHKEDFQRFFKRFRKRISVPVKYFCCGEYGDQSARPHYHAIVLGWEPPIDDLVCYGSKGGRKYYYSGILLDLWPFGFNVVGTVTKDSLQYVTGYIRKKLNGKLGKEKYGDLTPPFQLQSQGIGLDYCKEHIDGIVDKGGISTDYGVSSLPRYIRRKFADSGVDFGATNKEKALLLDAAVDQYYADGGLNVHDSLLAVLASRKVSDLKFKSQDRVLRNNILTEVNV